MPPLSANCTTPATTPRRVAFRRPPLVERYRLFRWAWYLDFYLARVAEMSRRRSALTDAQNDDRLCRVFYRRTGPIAAAVSVTIDGPAGLD